MAVARFEQSRRVGELAAVTGLTVRTLHYYEEIGLLTPSQRTHAGHRHGTVVHGEVYAGDGVVWMHQEERTAGLASPRSVGAATANVAVLVDDVDAHHRHAVSQGAPVVYEPVDQPYGYRVYSAHDLEGHLWSFMKPLD